MSGQIPTSDNLWPLLNAACDNALTETQIQELAALLDSDPAVRRVFLDHVQLRRNIRLLGRANRVRDLGLARIHATLPQASPPGSPSPVLGFLGSAIHGTVGYVSTGWPVAYLTATVIFGIGLLIGAHTYVSQPVQIAEQSVPLPSRLSPLPSTVGRITGMVDCKWLENPKSEIRNPKEIQNQKSEIINQKSLVRLGDTFALASGLMEITYDTGAKVILQGPVTYEVESAAGGYLSVGKLTAKLEKKAEEVASGQWPVAREGKTNATNSDALATGHWPLATSSNPQSPIPNPSLSTNHYPLFTIKTPTAIVTDLGTEFGVEVSKEGHTTSHVFRGLVTLQVTSNDGRTEGNAQVLHESESARVENRGNQGGVNRIVMLGPSAEPANFVRQIARRTVKTFDLVDVVAGGDGFSGRRNAGIDPTNGRIAATPNKEYKSESEYPVGDRRYHRVEGLSFVDGVFVPDGSRGPVQTDSAGHVFAEFRATSNQSPGYIWAGGVIPFNSPDVSLTKLGDIDYASAGHGVLSLHANKAVSFDLAAIRRANPGWKVLRFRATAGNAEPVSIKGQLVSADLLILVDGQERFKRREINGCNGAFPVLVRIHDNDRFLTLVSTDGGNGVCWDWITFGDPRLELAQTGPSGG